MNRPVAILVAIMLGALGWLFVQYFEVQGLDFLHVRRRPAAAPNEGVGNRAGRVLPTAAPLGSGRGKFVRVAAWDLDSLSLRPDMDPEMKRLFIESVQQFDVIALQGLKSASSGVMAELMRAATGDVGTFVFVPSPDSDGPLAFIYNAQTLVFDVDSLYVVVDPDELLSLNPLVGWFRVRGPDAKSAFTFSVVNYYVDPAQRERELSVIGQTLFRVCDDGRGEDDVILCGNLQADNRGVSGHLRSPRLEALIVDTPTDVQLATQTLNLIVDQAATVEFSGASGTFDYLRAFNLTIDKAQQLSPYLPVWAEFQRREGARVTAASSAARATWPTDHQGLRQSPQAAR
jgi:hypothetical protein